MVCIRLAGRANNGTISVTMLLKTIPIALIIMMCCCACFPADATPPETETENIIPPAPSTTNSPTPSPTKTNTLEIQCGGDPSLVPPTLGEPETWIETITPWLLAGGDPGEIPLPGSGTDVGAAWLDLNGLIDINGDGIQDLLLLTGFPREDQQTAGGVFQAYVCDLGSYQLALQITPSQDWSGPEILYIGDLTADGIEDLVVVQKRCGAHTCFLLPQVLTWDGSLQNRMTIRIDELPNPLLEIDEQGATGPEMRITVRGPGSVGAGPFRPFTQVFTWQPEQKEFVLQREEQTPAIFRIHVFDEAENAVEVGDLSQATALFTRVIEDRSLDDWIHGESGRDALAAIAYYRLMQLQLEMGDVQVAAGTLAALQNENIEEPVFRFFSQLAQDLWDTTQLGGSLPEACGAARSILEAQDVEFFQSFDYGYSNRVIRPTEICPY